MNDEKVCLTKTQMDNILDAQEKLITGQKGGCSKAKRWVSGYWGKGGKKKKKEPKDPVESWVNRKIIRKIEGWADGFF